MDCYTAFVVNYHNHSRTDSLHNTSTKAEFAEEGTFFANRFPSLRTFGNKKLEFEKTKPTYYTTFKTDKFKVVFVFSISNFFSNKN